MKRFPKVTVVTVCYNCCDVIERTMLNVLRQTYPNLEYIVIDGASTDGTRDIVARYADRLDYWLSESDKGIYDAMNKGIRAASGEWIIFRNAGDYFFKPTTVEDVFRWYEDKGETFIVGGTRCFGTNGYRDKFYNAQYAEVWHCAYISHPSTFIRQSVQKNNYYSCAYRIASDYRFFQKLILENAAIVLYGGIVSLFDCESGISTTHLSQSWKEMLMIRKELGAPDNIIKETRKKYLRTKIFCLFSMIMKRNAWIRRLYSKSHLSKDWVWQSMDMTLKDI